MFLINNDRYLHTQWFFSYVFIPVNKICLKENYEISNRLQLSIFKKANDVYFQINHYQTKEPILITLIINHDNQILYQLKSIYQQLASQIQSNDCFVIKDQQVDYYL